MLSGIGPRDQLEQFGIQVIQELPGVGQGLWNHLSAQATFKAKDGVALTAHDVDAPHYGLHYTSQGSDETNDMVLRTSTVVDERAERVPGVRTKYLTGDVPQTEQLAYRVPSDCPRDPGTSGWRLPTPTYSQSSTIVISNTRTTCGG